MIGVGKTRLVMKLAIEARTGVGASFFVHNRSFQIFYTTGVSLKNYYS